MAGELNFLTGRTADELRELHRSSRDRVSRPLTSEVAGSWHASFVRIEGAPTVDGGVNYYPGTAVAFDAATATWIDVGDANAVWVVSSTGESLSLGEIRQALLFGDGGPAVGSGSGSGSGAETGGVKPVFMAGGAGGDVIVRITGSVRVAAGSGGSDCEGSAFEADASGNWPSGVGSMGSGVGHNAYTGYLQRRECLLDPWEDYGDEVYVDDMNGRKLVVGDRYQVVRQGSVGGVASYTTRDDPTSPVTSGDSGDSGDSGSGSGDDCEEIHVLDCPASGSGDSGSGSGDGCVYVGEVSISNVGGVCTGTFTLTIPTRIVRVPRCSTGGSA